MSTPELISPWPDEAEVGFTLDVPKQPRGGVAYARLVAAQRLLQDRVAGAALPADVSADVAARLEALCDELAAYQASEHERHDGWRPDLPGRGHPLLPTYIVDEDDELMLRGRVTFTRFYLGGNGAAHGGSQPLLFDDLLGRVVNHRQAGGVARTAYLKVTYRKITPIGRQLRFEATVDRIDGRKRWASARLYDAHGDVVADAEGLFIELRPGQP